MLLIIQESPKMMFTLKAQSKFLCKKAKAEIVNLISLFHVENKIAVQ